MFKKTLALAGLTLSLSANAVVISIDSSFGTDTITRDTDTGLNWLDLTMTSGRSYVDIASELGNGGEFEGWRYASRTEVQTLWQNFGVSDGTNTALLVTDAQYANFVTAAVTLGNTFNLAYPQYYDYGVQGYTGTETSLLGYQYMAGMYHDVRLEDTDIITENNGRIATHMDDFTGSYLVQISPVPIPSAGWLFISAVVGLAGAKRINRR